MADKILAVLAHQSPGGRPVSHSSANPRPPPWGHSLSMGGASPPVGSGLRAPTSDSPRRCPKAPPKSCPRSNRKRVAPTGGWGPSPRHPVPKSKYHGRLKFGLKTCVSVTPPPRHIVSVSPARTVRRHGCAASENARVDPKWSLRAPTQACSPSARAQAPPRPAVGSQQPCLHLSGGASPAAVPGHRRQRPSGFNAALSPRATLQASFRPDQGPLAVTHPAGVGAPAASKATPATLLPGPRAQPDLPRVRQ